MIPYITVKLDTSKITDWDSFHTVFASIFGFPDFYGRNMDAWIDCMSYLDEPEAGMSTIHAPNNGVVVLELSNMREFRKRCPDLALAIEECSAFVNWRRSPILVLSYDD
jgi:hypothetical protein